MIRALNLSTYSYCATQSDVIGDGQGIMNLTFFTFLVLLLLSPMSVQLFGGDFKFVPEDEPSMRFDNSYQAFLALFQIMTGENWTDILYDAMHSQEDASVSYAAIYMIFLYFSVHCKLYWLLLLKFY